MVRLCPAMADAIEALIASPLKYWLFEIDRGVINMDKQVERKDE